MDPLSAMGVWALSLVGIATLVCAARKAGAVHDPSGTRMIGSFTNVE